MYLPKSLLLRTSTSKPTSLWDNPNSAFASLSQAIDLQCRHRHGIVCVFFRVCLEILSVSPRCGHQNRQHGSSQSVSEETRLFFLLPRAAPGGRSRFFIDAHAKLLCRPQVRTAPSENRLERDAAVYSKLYLSETSREYFDATVWSTCIGG